MAQGPSDTILVVIRITLRIRESKVRNPGLRIAMFGGGLCSLSASSSLFTITQKIISTSLSISVASGVLMVQNVCLDHLSVGRSTNCIVAKRLIGSGCCLGL